MEQITDTLLHELSHIIFGPHNADFNNLWNELRDEHQSLLMKGYTGEGFLSQGQKLGGRRIPLDEMRRQARMAAEKRNATTTPNTGGHRLGGARPVQRGVDMRKVIADAASRRNSITDGCASGSASAGRLVDQQEQDGFRTTAEQDDANDWAIAQALQDLMYDEEMQRLGAPTGNGGLAWDPQNGLSFDRDLPSNTPSPSSSSSAGLAWSKEAGLSFTPSTTPTTSTTGQPYPTRSTSHPSQGRPLSRLVTEQPTPPPPSRTPFSSNSRLIPQHEEQQLRDKKLPPTPPRTSPPRSSSHPTTPHSQPTTPQPPTTISLPPNTWACPQCTLHNPLDFLACEACGLEQPPQPIPENRRFASSHMGGSVPSLPRPPPQRDLRGPAATTPFEPARGRLGWNCLECGTFMERQWWTCSLCGTMKAES